jgi:hypothetical protein
MIVIVGLKNSVIRRIFETAQYIHGNSHGGDYEEWRLLGYKNPSSYLTGDTVRLHYRVQPVNAM